MRRLPRLGQCCIEAGDFLFVRLQSLDMKLNGFLYQLKCFLLCLSGGNTARKIRHGMRQNSIRLFQVQLCIS